MAQITLDNVVTEFPIYGAQPSLRTALFGHVGGVLRRGSNGAAKRVIVRALDNVSLTINHGETVTWEWRDGGERHNVTFRGFRSHTMGHGAYTVRFLGKGTFSYRCTLHEAEGMRGKIIVH